MVDTDRYAHPNRAMNPVWSPDSRFLAYEKQQESHFKAIFVYDSKTGTIEQVTDGIADATSPVWDQSGEYLYFLASTDYGLQTGWLDMSSYDPGLTRNLYALVLTADGKAPGLPKSDEEEEVKKVTSSPDTKKEKKSKDKDEDKPEDVSVKIDFAGIMSRAVGLQMEPRNYAFLVPSKAKNVLVAEFIPNENGLKLIKYDVEKGESEDLTTGLSSIVASSNAENILLQANGSWSISSSTAAPKSEDKLTVSAQMKVAPGEEYAQIFKEAWRYMRDFLYVNNVHGAPWDKVYSWYQPWVKYVKHRTDLNYLVDILSGEVAIGHSYVSGGDMPDIDRVPVGLLGADYEIKDGYYVIDKIYTGETWNPDIESPLGLPGLGVKEGNYLVAINGQPLTAKQSVYELMEQTAGRTISISVNSQPGMSGAKTINVKPVSNEYMLRYVDWVEGNRRKVDELSGGKLAYVYIPNTSGSGFYSFNRYFFAQQDKKGVILDERNNGGGSAADYMIDILTREPMGYFNSKANDHRPWTTPISGLWGPKVMLINERSGSGGDLLPYMFKFKDLGPLVGTRTWGGLVGTWDTPRFIDGGRMVAPRGGFYDINGEWAVEGEGIAPDVEVIQDPKLVLEGHDPQLEKGVEEALKLLEKEGEFELKPEPAPPVRWKRPEGWDNE